MSSDLNAPNAITNVIHAQQNARNRLSQERRLAANGVIHSTNLCQLEDLLNLLTGDAAKDFAETSQMQTRNPLKIIK